MSQIADATVKQFASLFRGLDTAYGTSEGGWVHSKPILSVYSGHLDGKQGIGIGPLMPDGRCWFGAIDLDRPDFELAQEMMKLLPGVSWLERSRSGNAHVLVFFSSPIEAWVVRGIMRETLAALGQRGVEIFPKSDFLHPGMVGSYLNLPYFGDTRRVVGWKTAERLIYPISEGATPVCIGENDQMPPLKTSPLLEGWSVAPFVQYALEFRNDPEDWRKRARWLGVPSPEERKSSGSRDFGTSPNLHICASYIIEHRDDHPVREGHRAALFFSLAKMLSNWSEIDHDEAWNLMALVNDSSPDPISSNELGRILSNAERGEFTSTGCDDPLVMEYRHPDCKIGLA